MFVVKQVTKPYSHAISSRSLKSTQWWIRVIISRICFYWGFVIPNKLKGRLILKISVQLKFSWTLRVIKLHSIRRSHCSLTINVNVVHIIDRRKHMSGTIDRILKAIRMEIGVFLQSFNIHLRQSVSSVQRCYWWDMLLFGNLFPSLCYPYQAN